MKSRGKGPSRGMEFFQGPAALGLRLRQLLELIEVQIAEVMAAGGCRVKAQCTAILLLLDCRGPLSLAEIANRLRASHQLTSQRVSWMQEGGFASVLPDPDDRRRRQVVLTEAGKEEGRKLRSFLIRLEKAYQELFDELGLDLCEAVVQAFEDLRTRPLAGRFRPRRAIPKKAGAGR